MEDDISDAVARFVLEVGSLKKGMCTTVQYSCDIRSIFIPAKAGLRAYARKHPRYSILPLYTQILVG